MAASACFTSGTLLVLGAVGGFASGAILAPIALCIGGFTLFCGGNYILDNILDSI